MTPKNASQLFQPLELPCGAVLKNRIIKSAMSDSLGDGRGNPTNAQTRLYERWAHGGVAASIIGEVQSAPINAEKPGNLVLCSESALEPFRLLASKASVNDSQLWLQLGHAGAMAYPAISRPRGPSEIDIPGLTCSAMTNAEVHSVPAEFARTAMLAESTGFAGVQIHAAHGFLLSQFLSPLFNKRSDEYGGSIESRMKLLLDVIDEVRRSVSAGFVVAVKLNSTDQLEGGLSEEDALKVVARLDNTGVDLIDISGGTYFPGAKSASDSAGGGPYFLPFVCRARELTCKPLMLTGGFKTGEQAESALRQGNTDVIGLARLLALDPALADKWRSGLSGDPVFPQFSQPPEGAITAWYTMRLTQLGEDRDAEPELDLLAASSAYEQRDQERAAIWNQHFYG